MQTFERPETTTFDGSLEKPKTVIETYNTPDATPQPSTDETPLQLDNIQISPRTRSLTDERTAHAAPSAILRRKLKSKIPSEEDFFKMVDGTLSPKSNRKT